LFKELKHRTSNTRFYNTFESLSIDRRRDDPDNLKVVLSLIIIKGE
jgi:hypothetical protein